MSGFHHLRSSDPPLNPMESGYSSPAVSEKWETSAAVEALTHLKPIDYATEEPRRISILYFHIFICT